MDHLISRPTNPTDGHINNYDRLSKAPLFFECPYFHSFLSPSFTQYLLTHAEPVAEVSGLMQVGRGGGLENQHSFHFMVELYESIKFELFSILAQRTLDRAFIDARVRSCFEFNKIVNRKVQDQDYATVLGMEDSDGRIVVGPLNKDFSKAEGKPIIPPPDFLKGPHVTLFGPPDHPKMAINAMNAYHRRLNREPPIVEELLRTASGGIQWGADTEDSKTPIRSDLIDAGINLTACFEHKLSYADPQSKASYTLAESHLSSPIKRFPGLALPCPFLFYKNNPIPLHIYDFALHVYRNFRNPKALVFYIPKIENEEEARYIHKLIESTERILKKHDPSYTLGTIRLMIVLENPRAILRINEIIDALHPYFIGASLGWHDYLASTARLFKEDGNYRIPVKSDPDIVINHIKESHQLLAEVVGARGGIKVGGMYGILPINRDITSPSFQVALRGFFKDVITQLKRDLSGFWVAHPDFVRLGLAIVEGWRLYKEQGDRALFKLAEDLLDPAYSQEITKFIDKEDVFGLNRSDPNYVRSLLVADLESSELTPNHAPSAVRYNVFQSLQYIADWLSGNGCVALPSSIDGVPVRVMDDFATAERSRWEVWHEIYHGRFKVEDLVKIAHEELLFIRKNHSSEHKIVEVSWNDKTEKWYPIAFSIMLQLMTNPNPVEFASELLLPFTSDIVRSSANPWNLIFSQDPEKYRLTPEVEKLSSYFEACGSLRFAKEMANGTALDLKKAKDIILSFSREEIIEAAGFHGDIGESPKFLDHLAKSEQERLKKAADNILDELKSAGKNYFEKFGFKFLVSAKGKSGEELLSLLKVRINNPLELEISNAREALWEITKKRLSTMPIDSLGQRLEELREAYHITGSQIALISHDRIQTLTFGESIKGVKPVKNQTLFELASLSKTVAAAFSCEYFRQEKISLDTSVNALFTKVGSSFRLAASKNDTWADNVTIRHLMNHTALNMHYVHGFPSDQKMPSISELCTNPQNYSYPPLDVISHPGSIFHYSGGGYLVLEYLIETLSGKKIQDLCKSFIEKCGLNHWTFESVNLPGFDYAHGYDDKGREIHTSRLNFPAFAAGALGCAEDMLKFLRHLGHAYHDLSGSGGISHDTAVEMLFANDLGSKAFMGCLMGLGVFVAEAGENRLAVHQGANEGFRGLYAYCYAGPDKGKGFVILSNGDHHAVPFTAAAAQEIFKHFNLSGIHFENFSRTIKDTSSRPEEFVNLGYKKLLFEAFEPTKPNKILQQGPKDPLAAFNLLSHAKILSVSNERFARAENLFSEYFPIFDPKLYGAQGKTMDSWETVRHNSLECDCLELELASAAPVSYISISTAFHDGNHAEFVRILGRLHPHDSWMEIFPKTKLKGHALFRAKLRQQTGCVSSIRIELFPDGGLTRVGMYSDLPKDHSEGFESIDVARSIRWDIPIPTPQKPMVIKYQPSSEEIIFNLQNASKDRIDYASSAFGGLIIRASNEHYGPASQLISPFPPLHMFDGFESSRSRQAGHFEEIQIKLGKRIKVEKIVLDFQYFINNNPRDISIFALQGEDWIAIVPYESVKAYAGNKKEWIPSNIFTTQDLLIRIFPDGGINRIHVYGTPV